MEGSTRRQNFERLQPKLLEKEKEALDVIKEDVCQWLANTLRENVNSDTFWEKLHTGVLLCKLANLIHHASKKYKLKSSSIKYDEKNAEEPFHARVNTSNFISWCRELGVEEAVIFESEGLVLRKDEKRVILCLLDVARFAERVGIPPPQLVRMEREIDTHDGEHSRTQELTSQGSKNVHVEKVISSLNDCVCDTNPLRSKVHANGKFIISGGKIRGEKTFFARVLSDRIMIRVGGGWDTLDHFLLEYDPCRILKITSGGSSNHSKIVITSTRT